MKITIEGNVFEGTPEEIKEMMTLMGAEFPVKSEEVEEETPQTITHKGSEYTLVDRKAQPGDVVVFTENTSCCVDNNVHYGSAVIGSRGDVAIYGDDGSRYSVYFDKYGRTEANVKVYAPIKEEQPPKVKQPNVGDIVVITANTNCSRNMVGDVGKVVEKSLNDEYSVSVEVPERPDIGVISGNYTKFDEMRLATPAEIEAYEKAEAKAEFKVGDYARVTSDNYEHKVGHIVRINRHKPATNTFDFGVDRITYGGTGYIAASNIEKLTAEEVAEAEQQTKWGAIGRKPNEYKKGDIVRILDGTGSKHKNGDIGEIVNTAREMFEVETARESNIGGWALVESIELITPVEARFDRA